MNLIKLLELKGLAESTKVSADPSVFVNVLEGLGAKDTSYVESLAKAVALTARNPEQTLMEWFREGGLARFLAGQKFEDRSGDDNVLQCPHCAGLLILSAP